MVRVKYREGDWFAVPLMDGGFAVGLVARANPKAALLGYFFGPRRDEVPSLADVVGLTVNVSILVGRFGHLGLIQGKWPIIGRVAEWKRADWPMPAFVRYEELTGRSFVVFYDDEDPAKLLREEQIAPGADEQRPKDGLMGGGYVERALTELLR